MKLTALLFHRLRWINLPGALLVALLQRTPVLRVATAVEGIVAASPVGAVLRSAAALVGLGAVHSLAGATTVIHNGSNPLNATVGTPIPQIVFAATGAGVGAPGSWQVSGQIAPGLNLSGITGPAVFNISNPVLRGTPTTAGTFTMQLQSWEGPNQTQNTTPLYTYTVIVTGAATVAPSFTMQPVSQSVSAGASVTFSAAANGTPTPTYQWRRDGADINGATDASLTLPNVQLTDAGEYLVVARNSAGSANSAIATLTVAGIDPTARLTNLSVRAAMSAGQTLIVGVVVDGGTHQVLVRAAGPALAALGVPNTMADPRLDLFDAQPKQILANDDWPTALGTAFDSVGAFSFPTGSKDAAFMQILSGGYTVQARGTGAGVVLVEAYDLGTGTMRLSNVSARNFCGTGDNILIAGFNITGSGAGAKRVLIRAVGPKLAAFDVSGFLADPKLELYTGAGVKVAENDNWDASLASTFTNVGAFSLDGDAKSAALLLALNPGTYTAQVKGADGGTGEALIEVYEVP